MGTQKISFPLLFFIAGTALSAAVWIELPVWSSASPPQPALLVKKRAAQPKNPEQPIFFTSVFPKVQAGGPGKGRFGADTFFALLKKTALGLTLDRGLSFLTVALFILSGSVSQIKIS